MNSKVPLFSVIIPTRNRSSLLNKAINSVLNQKYGNFELIIVDDGSTDNTKELVESFADDRIRYFYQDHSERSTARNHGIEKASGEYICFLDDDDFYNEKYLLDFSEYYKVNQFPEVILRTGFIRISNDREKKSTIYDVRKHRNPARYAAYNMCGVWSLAIPRNFLTEDRFPSEFPHWQDTHLILRLFMDYNMTQLESYNYNYVIHSEMGSARATSIYDPIKRADLNVAAMEDLWSTHARELQQHLPKNTLHYLRAEKFIQYANSPFISNKTSKVLFKKSIRNGMYFRLIKSYLIYIKKKLF